MAISIGKLQVQCSGGASNVDQQTSLGGAISTAGANKVLSQSCTAPSVVTGVTVNDAMGNPEGAGTLKYDFGTGGLLWKPSGGVTYDGMVIAGDGVYTLGTTGGYIVVTVVSASLPGSTQQENLTIANLANKTFDNISAQESLVGDTEYRCFYIKNTDATNTAYDVSIWIKTQPIGDDDLAIALDSGGKNVTALGPLTTEGDGSSLLTGLTFSAPSTQATGLQMGDLAPGDRYAFWIKRTIPASTTAQVLHDTSAIGISALL